MDTTSEQGEPGPDDPREAEVVGAPDGVPEQAKPSVTGTAVGEGDDQEQSDPGGDSDTT